MCKITIRVLGVRLKYLNQLTIKDISKINKIKTVDMLGLMNYTMSLADSGIKVINSCYVHVLFIFEQPS